MLNSTKLLSPENVEIGDYVCINHHTTLDGHGGLKIGNYVMIGPNCNILSSNHGYSAWDRPMMAQSSERGPVIINDDVWLCANVVILPNVTIGRGAVLAANAVVTENVEPYSIVGGVPARLIKYRFGVQEQQKALAVDLKEYSYAQYGIPETPSTLP